jgi:hypothetical protein
MSWFGHHGHNQPAASGPNQVFKIFCKANENYCLTVRDDGNVVLAPANAKDVYQVASADLCIYCIFQT